MCESCGPDHPQPVNPELMNRFRESLTARGIDSNAVTDAGCYGNPSERTSNWIQNFGFNLKILFGWV